MNTKIAIINFPNSNIKSIFSALKKIKLEPVLVNKKKELNSFSNLILPGVGTFGTAMNYLEQNEMIEDIKKFHYEKKKILGICLGMQILLQKGNEFGHHKGLSLIKGTVKKIPLNQIHLGWNKVIFEKNYNTKNFFGYFVHSYYTEILEEGMTIATTTINNFNFISYFKKNNLLACQFHPEKSGEHGLKLIKNFFHKNEI